MITSDKQYTAAKEQLAMLTTSLSSPKKEGVPERIAKAGRAHLQELICEIQQNVEEYETLKNSEPSDIEIHSLDDLMIAAVNKLSWLLSGCRSKLRVTIRPLEKSVLIWSG